MIIINLIHYRTIRKMLDELIAVFGRKEHIQISCNIIVGGDDAGNDLISETDARGNETKYTVNGDTSRNEEVIDRCGNKTAYEYDESGRTTKVTSHKPKLDIDGEKITDENGNILYEEIANVSYSYDSFDNLTEIVRGDGLDYVLKYNAFHNLESIGINGKTDGELTICIRTLVGCRIEFEGSGDATFIFDLTENHLEQFKKCRLLLHAIIYVNVVMASLENKKQVVIGGIAKALAARAVNIIQIAVSRRNVIVFHEGDIARCVDALSEYKFLDTVCPHTPFTVGTNRHVRLQLCNTVLSVACINGFLLTLNDDADGALCLLGCILVPNDNICTWFIRTYLQCVFNLNLPR